MGDGSPSKYDSKGKGRAPHNGDVLALDLDAAEEGSGTSNGGGFMQMQLVEQQVRLAHLSGGRFTNSCPKDSYIQQRSTAIESIETTIAELGQIFTQLAHMVAEQRETVQRIDADTHDIADNVRLGHNELLKYWGRISNDRWLMLKIFGVLIVFVSFHPLAVFLVDSNKPLSSYSSSWYHDLLLDALGRLFTFSGTLQLRT